MDITEIYEENIINKIAANASISYYIFILC